MGNFSVLSTLKWITALFVGYEEDVFHIHFKSHRCCSPKLLRSAASSLGDLWGPAADRPLCFKGITHFCAPDSGLEGGRE